MEHYNYVNSTMVERKKTLTKEQVGELNVLLYMHSMSNKELRESNKPEETFQEFLLRKMGENPEE
jgi:hypothetical protein